jgi:diguanylate cyclase (GGDEF)-like protein
VLNEGGARVRRCSADIYLEILFGQQNIAGRGLRFLNFWGTTLVYRPRLFWRSVRGKRRNKLCLLLAALLSPYSQALGMNSAMTQYVQSTLTDKSGLPQNSVSAVAQTHDGYLWFATEEGLARYDGLQTTVFDTIRYKELKDNYIKALASGQDGSLWVGTRSGVTRFKDGAFHTYLAARSPISTIYEAKDGQVWVGSLDGLYVIDGDHVRLYTTRDGLPSNSINGIVQSPDGTLWFGTGKGLASRKDGTIRSYAGRDGLSTDSILSLAASHDGCLWMATEGGLFRWKGRSLNAMQPPGMPQHARITSLLEDSHRTIWIAFEHSGVGSLRNGASGRYTAIQGLPTNDVTQLFEDREGHLWVGLSEGGVTELRDGSFSSFGEREGLSDDMVWSILEARDRSLWVGTNSKGLDHIDRNGKVHAYTARDGLPSGSIYALCEGADGSLWIGSAQGGLSHLKDGRITVFRDPANTGGRVVSILQDPSGDLLLGFHEINGLVRFHQGHFQHYSVPGLVNTTAIAPDGSVWIGSDHSGVSHVRGNSVTSYTTQNGLLSNFAQAVYVDRDGVVWAGTSPGGLNRIKNGHITTYSIDQGLFDLTVGAIVEDDSGYLWMTCNRGIYKVSKKELNDYADGKILAIHSVVYGLSDGLRSAECNFAADPSVWKGSDGHLWFATTAGIASIDPNRSRVTIDKPSLLIERVLFNQKPIPFEHGATVGPTRGDVEIEFTAPNFVAPKRIHFRYRLRGFDSDWVDVDGRRQAYYTKLPPGHYRFEVQGANGDGAWNSNDAQLNLVVAPYFWQSGWFRVLCGLVLVFACVALYRFRVRYLVERNRELEDRVNQRTSELQEAIRVTETAHRALHEQATKDGLTNLWNRRTIFEMLGKEIARAGYEGESICVLMADVDHFKEVNDTYGHLVGDTVLQGVATRIVDLTRASDFAGRYGGEEFVIVLPGCSLADGMKRAEEFRQAIADMSLRTSFGSLRVTCSFGVAASSNTLPVEALIHQADEALYSAKRSGRNCIHALAMQPREALMVEG